MVRQTRPLADQVADPTASVGRGSFLELMTKRLQGDLKASVTYGLGFGLYGLGDLRASVAWGLGFRV